MKRVARIIGFLGGVAAVVWAMRDRFVSIAAPREPETPSFRVVTTPAPPTEPTAPTQTPEAEDLTEINGIGPVFARRLMEAGISTFDALADAEPERVAEIVGAPESRASDWIDQAQSRV